MLDGDSVVLGDVLGVKHGFAFPGAEFSDDPSFPTLLTPGNFEIGGGFREAKAKTFTGGFPEEYRLRGGDLIVSMTDLSKEGATLGLPALVPDSGAYLHNQRIGLVEIKDPSRVTAGFLHYLLRTDAYRSHILGTASGSTVRHTSPSRIGSFVARLPKLDEQRAIAEVLGALDDKIAANMRLADTSAALVEAKFDMCADAGRVEGGTFGELADVGGGGTPSTADPTLWAGEIAWATPTDVTALQAPYLSSTSRTLTDEGLAACASPLYPVGSILMTSRATIGAFAIAERPTAVNQGFIVVNARRPGLRWWLFHQMRARVPEFLSHANGATFLELSRGRFKQLTVWTAEEAVLREFDRLADCLHMRASAAMRENRRLAELRDTLLPELMSGRLRVRDAERTVEEVV